MEPQIRLHGTNLITFRDFARDLRMLNRSPRTIQSYQEAAEQLADFTAGNWCPDGCDHDPHDGAPFDQMRKAHIRDYLIEVGTRHSSHTAANRHRSLRRFFNWMVTEDVLADSPMARLAEPSTNDEEPTDIPPIDDVRAILAICERRHDRNLDPRRKFSYLRDAAIIRLFCEAGAPRVSEMAGLELGRVDLATDLVYVHGKGSKWRAIPFGDRTAKAITRYLRVRPTHPLVIAAKAKDPASDGPARIWLGWRGKPLDSSGIYQMIKRRCEEAGVPRIHPHQLRHLATDRFYEAGGREQDAMALFGWSSAQMAHHYAQKHAGRRAVTAARRVSIGDDL